MTFGLKTSKQTRINSTKEDSFTRSGYSHNLFVTQKKALCSIETRKNLSLSRLLSADCVQRPIHYYTVVVEYRKRGLCKPLHLLYWMRYNFTPLFHSHLRYTSNTLTLEKVVYLCPLKEIRVQIKQCEKSPYLCVAINQKLQLKILLSSSVIFNFRYKYYLKVCQLAAVGYAYSGWHGVKYGLKSYRYIIHCYYFPQHYIFFTLQKK